MAKAEVIKLARYKIELLLDTVELDSLQAMMQNGLMYESHIDAEVRRAIWDAIVEVKK